jgi:16S rRNA (cytidine1402-2'-O)-methyltransferase
VEAVPGASAVLTALVSSGLPTDRFLFEGFLPPKKGRKKRLKVLQDETATIICYENPNRLMRTLKDLYSRLGDRPAVVSRELTKMYEEKKRGTISELISYFTKTKVRGELVIMVGKSDKNVFF